MVVPRSSNARVQLDLFGHSKELSYSSNKWLAPAIGSLEHNHYEIYIYLYLGIRKFNKEHGMYFYLNLIAMVT